MIVLPKLQAANASSDASVLRESLRETHELAGVLPALDEELCLAHERIATLAIDEAAAPVTTAQPPVQPQPPAASVRINALPLTLQEIADSTDNFAQVKVYEWPTTWPLAFASALRA
jgi:hypothetical protein|tara:strand:+ start:384 stop:734 length:351 start_codon:yes stop_codon:yes gene_type:complete